MLQRVVTALVAGPLFLAVVLGHPILARCSFAGLAFISAYELRWVFQHHELELEPLPLGLYLAACFFWPGLTAEHVLAFMTIYLGVLLFLGIVRFPRMTPAQIGVNLLAALYPVLPLLYAIEVSEGSYGNQAIALSLLLTWAFDTTAYFIGTLFGRHHPFPVLSPKKSVEGIVAGLLGTVLMGVIFCAFVPLFSMGQILPIALIAGFLAQCGDLAESMLKRFCGVKDSGALLPGHGGILDRFDAFFFVVVWMHIAVSYWGGLP